MGNTGLYLCKTTSFLGSFWRTFIDFRGWDNYMFGLILPSGQNSDSQSMLDPTTQHRTFTRRRL